jgi:hypothetical protein
LKARTGEHTPKGIIFSARCCRRRVSSSLRGMISQEITAATFTATAARRLSPQRRLCTLQI